MKFLNTIFFLFIFFIDCINVDEIKKINDETFNREVLLTLLASELSKPKQTECDPYSFKENCNGSYKQICNGHGLWENYILCPTSCTVIENQSFVECK